jgi:hypothetical protein
LDDAKRKGMKNEVLCKVLCHHICCPNIRDLRTGFGPVFWQEAVNASQAGKAACIISTHEASPLVGVQLCGGGVGGVVLACGVPLRSRSGSTDTKVAISAQRLALRCVV